MNATPCSRAMRRELAEELGARVAIAALALDRLDDDRGDVVLVRLEDRLDRLERARLGGAVLGGVVGERERVRGERRRRATGTRGSRACGSPCCA